MMKKFAQRTLARRLAIVILMPNAHGALQVQSKMHAIQLKMPKDSLLLYSIAIILEMSLMLKRRLSLRLKKRSTK